MKILCLFTFLVASSCILAQNSENPFTQADTLRGSINPERAWWNILRYDITVKPDYEKKYISGRNIITYEVVQKEHSNLMQIDLKEPLKIDSILYDNNLKLNFERKGSVYYVTTEQQSMSSTHTVAIYYSGNPHVAVRPPWDGGWTFAKDDKGRPWMTVTCMETGASIWYPLKDHLSDEPDQGATLTMIVPNDLVGVANGRLLERTENNDGTTSYKWGVVNPISNYSLIPNIGHYVNFNETYLGLRGDLDLNYWVMDYNLEKAKNYMPKQVHKMLDSFEYWFGPYPFYEDGYKLIETDNTGMEHQTAVTYGNHYQFGYRGRGGALGLTFDFIIVHESGHEWFGNNITIKDIADMYIHESFVNYSETLYVEYFNGKEAANDYSYESRKGIKNDKPIIGPYGVNAIGSKDMYVKGGNMLHTIRHSIDNDKLFRNILAGLNFTFRNKTVEGKQILNYISQKSGHDYTRVFDQYLNTTQIPELNIYVDGVNGKIFYKWAQSLDGFNLPLSLRGEGEHIRIFPTQEWQSVNVNAKQQFLFTPLRIEKMYYLKATLVRSME